MSDDSCLLLNTFDLLAIFMITEFVVTIFSVLSLVSILDFSIHEIKYSWVPLAENACILQSIGDGLLSNFDNKMVSFTAVLLVIETTKSFFCIVSRDLSNKISPKSEIDQGCCQLPIGLFVAVPGAPFSSTGMLILQRVNMDYSI